MYLYFSTNCRKSGFSVVISVRISLTGPQTSLVFDCRTPWTNIVSGCETLVNSTSRERFCVPMWHEQSGPSLCCSSSLVVVVVVTMNVSRLEDSTLQRPDGKRDSHATRCAGLTPRGDGFAHAANRLRFTASFADPNVCHSSRGRHCETRNRGGDHQVASMESDHHVRHVLFTFKQNKIADRIIYTVRQYDSWQTTTRASEWAKYTSHNI